jgi:Flp pilus assembly protein TadD
MQTLESLDEKRDEKKDEKRDESSSKASHRGAESTGAAGPEKYRLILCLLLAMTTLALYNPVTRAPFLNYDDPLYFSENAHVRAGLTWKTVVWAFTTTELSDWKPIAWLSHTVDGEIFGFNPEGPHSINILLHTTNVVILFLILLEATGFLWRSLAVATLFALHPMNVESVAWIAERKNVLSMLFFLLALTAYGWYARRPSVGRYLAVTVAYALALMTKAQVITFPFALLLLDYWPLNRLATQDDRAGIEDSSNSSSVFDRPFVRSFGALVWEKLPWFALSAVSAIITMRAEVGATQMELPLWAHLANAALSYVKYVGKAFWPSHLAAIYPHPELTISIPAAVLSGCLILCVSILAILFHRRHPFLVGWFWFLGTMVPMIGLVQIGVHGMADRYAYIPFLGIFVIACWGAAECIEKWHVPIALAAASALAILLVLGFALHRQVSYWGDNVALWRHTLEITDNNYMAEDNLATALIVQGKFQDAVSHFQRAKYLRPDDAVAALNLATYEQMLGNFQAAIDGYTKIPLYTREPYLLASALVNSGYAHYSLKQFDKAKQDFESALRWQPENSRACRGLGLALQKTGHIDHAIQNYERAVELDPTPSGYLFLAQALDINQQPAAARAAEYRAARMTPDLREDVAIVRSFLGN